MRTPNRTRKILRILLGIVAGCALAFFIVERIQLANATSIEVLARRAPPALFSVGFDYSQNVLTQMLSTASDLGILPHLRSIAGLNESLASRRPPRQIGAHGFVTLDVNAALAGIFIRRLDSLAGAYLAALDDVEDDDDSDDGDDTQLNDGLTYKNDDSEADNNDGDDEDDQDDDETEAAGALTDPLHDVIDSFWNGGFATVGAAIQLDLNTLDRLRLGAALTVTQHDAGLKRLLTSIFPLKMQQYLAHAVLSRSSFFGEDETVDGVHQGVIELNADDIETDIDGLCPETSVGWDACSLFGMNRDTIRNAAETILSFIDDDFQVDLKFYWSVKGNTLLVSNRPSWVEALLDSRRDNTPVQSTISPEFFSSASKASTPTLMSYSFGADLKGVQEATLQLLALLRSSIRRETLTTIDLLSTPVVDQFLADVEEGALDLPSLGDMMSFVIRVKPSSFQNELWIANREGRPFEADDSYFHQDSTAQLFDIIKRLLVANSKIVKMTMVPFSDVTFSKHEGWKSVQTTLTTQSIAPLVQRRMRSLDKGARGIF